MKPFLAIIALGVLIALIYFTVAWFPVVDRLARWCEYYPNSLEECKE